eukprot:1548385-Amphidinium_carterae.2
MVDTVLNLRTRIDFPHVVAGRDADPATKSAIEDINRQLTVEARIHCGPITPQALTVVVVGGITGRSVPWMIPAQMRRPAVQWLTEPAYKLAEAVMRLVNTRGPRDDALAHMIAVIRVCAGSPPQGAAAITRQVRDLLEMTNPEDS